jgi:predicted transcriptional regulator
VPIEQLVDLIKVVNHALTSLNQPEPEPDTTVVSLTPAQIRKSITPKVSSASSTADRTRG